MKTSELVGSALDWAVAKCEGKIDRYEVTQIGDQLWCYEDGEKMRFFPSTSWAQGGPLVEREKISVVPIHPGWTGTIDLDEGDCMVQTNSGSTPLIAAMRCFVASKLGDEIEIPEELQ